MKNRLTEGLAALAEALAEMQDPQHAEKLATGHAYFKRGFAAIGNLFDRLVSADLRDAVTDQNPVGQWLDSLNDQALAETLGTAAMLSEDLVQVRHALGDTWVKRFTKLGAFPALMGEPKPVQSAALTALALLLSHPEVDKNASEVLAVTDIDPKKGMGAVEFAGYRLIVLWTFSGQRVTFGSVEGQHILMQTKPVDPRWSPAAAAPDHTDAPVGATEGR
jgi:hypothetical protein